MKKIFFNRWYLFELLMVSIFTFVLVVFVQILINWFLGLESESASGNNIQFLHFVILAPIVESIISFFVLLIFGLFFKKIVASILLGFLWGGLHSTLLDGIYSYVFFAVAFVAFFIYSMLYFKYKEYGNVNAVFSMILPHSFHNFYVFLFIL
ncbi:hypothetical protein [Vibrio mytili]|uniref:CAAX protease n=1 Tax=Vibrio mytili TaxID=50718 RepID=A0A0C3IDW1_9VIBR|nr:hypothetical protein [Vibrio mytili]KIN12547.1 hypothetical protein SU60_01890 [Vibrio mytili]